MKKITICIIAAFVSTAMICKATTIGFVGAADVNKDIPANYVSCAAGSGEGWTVSDGSGATPDIVLTWNSGDSDWEFHDSGNFGPVEDLHLGGAWDTNTANAVASGIAFILNSFDLGNALDQTEEAYGYNITLTKDSDGSTNWSYTTALYVAGSHEAIIANATGDSGEDYTLNFEKRPGTQANGQYSSIDNLSFSEGVIPEPCVLSLIALIGGGILWTRRKSMN